MLCNSAGLIKSGQKRIEAPKFRSSKRQIFSFFPLFQNLPKNWQITVQSEKYLIIWKRSGIFSLFLFTTPIHTYIFSATRNPHGGETDSKYIHWFTDCRSSRVAFKTRNSDIRNTKFKCCWPKISRKSSWHHCLQFFLK